VLEKARVLLLKLNGGEDTPISGEEVEFAGRNEADGWDDPVLRRLVHQNAAAAIKATPAMPPITPPAIGPALEELDFVVVPVGNGKAEVEPVDCGMPVDSGASTAAEAAAGRNSSLVVTSRYA